MKSAATEAVPPLANAYTIKILLGGINNPVVDEVILMDALIVLG